jgi:preprotein translocase subunit YajC
MLAVTLLGVTVSGREILVIVVIVVVVAVVAWFMTQRRRPR